MIGRLRSIAKGELKATQYDLNFYSHELREYVRYRKLGFGKGVPGTVEDAHALWENTHTATLEDYGLQEIKNGVRQLYHPDAAKFLGE